MRYSCFRENNVLLIDYKNLISTPKISINDLACMVVFLVLAALKKPFWDILKKYCCIKFFKTVFRSSHQRCYMKKTVLKNFIIFTGKHQACNIIKKGFKHRFFPVNTAISLRTPISENILERLLVSFCGPSLNSCFGIDEKFPSWMYRDMRK